MSERWFYTSVARASGVEALPRERRPLPREAWRDGDLVVARVSENSPDWRIESTNGRSVRVEPGDLVVGALGVRAATLEVVGDWRRVGDDLVLHALTTAGVYGRCTSRARSIPRLLTLRYEGHVVAGGEPANMGDLVPAPPATPFAVPTVLLVGTSMSAGKTTTARTIVRRLAARGLRVAGAKLSGVARYRDILSMQDAGADPVLDFVDAGLPSTICPRPELERALRGLLARIAESGADVLVVEAGASPLEPYNGDAVVDLLGENLRCLVLCASDPYAVVGVASAFGLKPDLVAGLATSTDAGIALIRKLSDAPALNVLDPASHAELDELLAARLEGSPAAAAPATPR
jgi:hypothetical protein